MIKNKAGFFIYIILIFICFVEFSFYPVNKPISSIDRHQKLSNSNNNYSVLNNKFGTKQKQYRVLSQSVEGVLSRITKTELKNLRIEFIKKNNERDQYSFEAQNGVIILKGSSVVAICRAFYDFLKNNHLGMLDWSGPHFRIPERWPDTPETKVVSPFQIRQAYNVVTFGYTTPYWNWQRWEHELDWQAMHGFNMMMAPIATEAIAVRVWKRLGLSQSEIDSFYVGPAHLPWQRMGNICSLGGTLPPEWQTDQVALQHKILDRMRQLGIRPIVQSFAGFVPKALKRNYPEITLHSTLWNAGFPPSQRPVLIMPDDPLFARITKMYIEEWKKEFGEADYFLVDSFNELELPKTGQPVTEMLAYYGEKTYQAINQAAPSATWVIQGWMFAYQRNIWNPATVKALFCRVPDDRILILDYANDYNNNWQPMNAFSGKQWVYGFVPNMGGKTAYTGDLSLYATGAGKALASPQKKNLVGFSISGEGIENNGVVYELLTDVAWSGKEINLDAWLGNYCLARYGCFPEKMKQSWTLMLKSCYKNLIDHPMMGWQTGNLGLGRINRDPEFFKAVRLFLDCSPEAGNSPCFQADAIERAAIVLGLKADEWFVAAKQAYASGQEESGDKASARGLELLTELDQLMESHPLNSLERWITFARSHSSDLKLQQFYESNARQIITVWGPPVNDYSCRIWSGLVRDFYRERMVRILESLKTGRFFDKNAWELNWVSSSGVSQVSLFTDPVSVARQLVQKALSEKLPDLSASLKNAVGEWSPANVGTDWNTVEWPVSTDQLKSLKGVQFVFKKGNHRLSVREVSVVADGKVVATDQHDGFVGDTISTITYKLTIPLGTTGNNGSLIRAIIKGNGGIDSHGIVSLVFDEK